jgi:hypothetical protein
LAERNQQLAERNQQLAERNQQLAERNQQLAERDQQIEDRIRFIKAIHESISWRITAPLRWFADMVMKALPHK